MIIITIVILAILGYLMANACLPNGRIVEKLSVGFFLSTSITTFIAFLLNILGIRYTTLSIYLTISGLVLVTLLINRLTKKSIMPRWNKVNIFKFRWWEIALAGFILVFLLTSLLQNFYWPIYTWDSLTLYDMRGKVFAIEGFMGGILSQHVYYLGYPLYTSLMHSLVYLSHYDNPHFIYSLIYVSFAIVFYINLKKTTSRFVALIFTLILVSTLQIYSHSMVAYTNLPYVSFMVSGILYLLSWQRTNNISELTLSGILIGMSGWIRTDDPFWLIAIFLVLLIIIVGKRKFHHLVVFLILALVPRITWHLFYNFELSRTVVSNLASVDKLDAWVEFKSKYFIKAIEVLKYFWSNVIVVFGALMLSYLSASVTYFLSKRKSLNTFFLLLYILISIIMVAGGIYFTSFTYTKWQAVGDSVQRMCMIFVPLILFAVARVGYETYGQQKTTKG